MDKRRVFAIISKAENGDRASRRFDRFLIVLILLSVLSIILESFRWAGAPLPGGL